jgi:hypothetical protein
MNKEVGHLDGSGYDVTTGIGEDLFKGAQDAVSGKRCEHLVDGLYPAVSAESGQGIFVTFL